MTNYEVVSHESVRVFIKNLDEARRARTIRFYRLFEQYGQALPTKYLKKIAPRVWELRPGDIRLFLAIKGDVGHVVHAIRKKSQKTPKRDLDLAIERIKREIS